MTILVESKSYFCFEEWDSDFDASVRRLPWPNCRFLDHLYLGISLLGVSADKICMYGKIVWKLIKIHHWMTRIETLTCNPNNSPRVQRWIVAMSLENSHTASWEVRTSLKNTRFEDEQSTHRSVSYQFTLKSQSKVSEFCNPHRLNLTRKVPRLSKDSKDEFWRKEMILFSAARSLREFCIATQGSNSVPSCGNWICQTKCSTCLG